MRLSLPFLLVALSSSITAFGPGPLSCQRASQPDPARGSIAGTVTISGKPAPHITVVLILDNHDVPVVARTVTDEAGHFKFEKISSGRYLIRAIAPTSTPAETANPDSEGKPVSLKDGEELQGVDLYLVRGGVITGRVTNSGGLPIVGEVISLCQIADDGSKRQCYQYRRAEFTTDDRGIYRIYGLAPGSYTASVGKGKAEMGGIDHQGRGNYVRTFYPSTTDESQASAIEVTSGGESTGIDIKLGKTVTAYRVTGRIINADTGQPAYFPFGGQPGSMVEVFEGPPFADKYFNRTLFGVSDNKGKFEIIGGLVTGRYAAAAKIEGENPGIYGELTRFEVTDHDLTDLELKVQRGSTIRGVVSSQDGGLNPQVLGRLRILAHTLYDFDGTSFPDALAGAESSGNVSADGSFLIRGLRPGKVRLGLGGFNNNPGVWIVRVEGAGAIQQERDTSVPPGYQYPLAFDVPTGVELVGLRIVVAIGSAGIHGRVRILGGALLGGLTVSVFYHKQDALSPERYSAYVDSDGQFKIDNLPAGTYVLETSLQPSGQSPGTVPSNIRHSSTTVTVAGGEQSEVALSIDLTGEVKRADQ